MPDPNFLFQTFRVGNPFTSYSVVISLFLSSLASTAIKEIPLAFNAVAAFFYSGAKFLQ